MKDIIARIADKGWATTDHMEVSNAFALANNLLIVRGESEMLDGVFRNDFHGNIVVKKAKERAARKKKK